MLFGLTPTDPAAFVVAASVLGLTTLLAGWLPARRASRVDPLIALRQE
jgi:ABC-type antimicrobial peptide transport system permease subunit